ncbi:MAG: hypothetical protein CMN27_13780 [Salinisphaera sp.]|nr:hypothetical protein [Salinisphaera sp.]
MAVAFAREFRRFLGRLADDVLSKQPFWGSSKAAPKTAVTIIVDIDVAFGYYTGHILTGF